MGAVRVRPEASGAQPPTLHAGDALDQSTPWRWLLKRMRGHNATGRFLLDLPSSGPEKLTGPDKGKRASATSALDCGGSTPLSFFDLSGARLPSVSLRLVPASRKKESSVEPPQSKERSRPLSLNPCPSARQEPGFSCHSIMRRGIHASTESS